jgi:hypothetical protein
LSQERFRHRCYWVLLVSPPRPRKSALCGGSSRPYPLDRDFRLAAALRAKLPGCSEPTDPQRERDRSQNKRSHRKHSAPLRAGTFLHGRLITSRPSETYVFQGPMQPSGCLQPRPRQQNNVTSRPTGTR